MKQLNWDIKKIPKEETYEVSEVRKSQHGYYYFKVNETRFKSPTKFEAMTARDNLAQHYDKETMYFPIKITIPEKYDIQR